MPFSYINTLEEKNNFETSPVPAASNKVVSKKSTLSDDHEENRPLMKPVMTPMSIKHDLSVVEEIETDPNIPIVEKGRHNTKPVKKSKSRSKS